MTNPQWLTGEEMRAWMAFLETSHLLQRRIDRQLRSAGGLTQPQYELLTRLAEAPGQRRRMAELAEQLVTSPSGVTYQVDQLVKAGLVVREACPDDDRGVVAVITEAGAQRLRQAAPGHVGVVRDYLIDRIGPAQLPGFTAVLERARDGLRAGAPPPRP